ncbi:retinoblastoma-like protein 1 [Stigmatopora argus]
MRGEESSDSESGRMEESVVRRSLETLCHELNMDERTATEAMDNFTAIWNTYTLEGELVHWLACALYAACRKGSVPTVGRGFMEGNCVSLTRILRTAKLSLMEFFSKMRKWSDMCNLSENFRLRVERLERNFEVSTVIFRKFEPIFAAMFREGPPPPARQPRGRKHRRLPCRSADVFKFCWTLFVYTKGNFHMIGDDLVNSYHLLLCCLDLVFGNALMCANRKELINPDFIGTSGDEVQACADEASPCVLERLCELHDGLVVEAKGIKQHYFKPYVHRLFCRQILKGNADLLTELLDPPNFQDNNKALNREYEEYVLTVGDFDERIFLDADADEEIGTPRKGLALSAGAAHAGPQRPPRTEKPAPLAPSTPLTGRRYLKEKDAPATPVSSATQSVARLQGMVAGLRSAPSEELMRIFKSCSRDPTEAIASQVETLGRTFKEQYASDCDQSAGSHVDFAENRLKLAEILFYKVLENVLVQESKRLPGKDLSALLEQDVFRCSLLACCLEVVLFSYSSQRTFPWILEIFKLAPFYFFKVIEVFIRSEEGLSRDMVKHLNLVEEQVLESRAWTSDSALWGALRAAGDKVPTVEEVNFSSSLDSGPGSGTGPATGTVPGQGTGQLPLVTLSPIVHPRIREVRSGVGSARKEVAAPSPLSVQERYSSPAAGSAKRRLFGDDPPAVSAAPPSPVRRLTLGSAGTLKIGTPGGQTTLLSIPLQGSGGERTITLIPVQPCDGSGGVTAQFLLTASPGRPVPVTLQASPAASEKQAAAARRPQRTGSLALFFRKLYHLASVRLRDLCARLDISSELRAKIWTGLEHSLVHATELMRDRHLDQMLLCAVYIMAKISKEAHTFPDIMKCYRSQPQASSHVYRSVLLRASPPEDRGDLIQFYNSVYVLKMKSYAVRYASLDNRTDAPPLSPFPSVRCHPASPRRVSRRHSLYVSPHKASSGGPAPHAFTYRFNSSPSKDLSDINRMLRQGCNGRKRAAAAAEAPPSATSSLALSSSSSPPGSASARHHSPAKRPCPDSANILFKRLQDVVSERQGR